VQGQQTSLSASYQRQQLSLKLTSVVLSSDGQRLGRGELSAQVPVRLGIDVSGEKLLEQLKSGAASVEVALHELELPRLVTLARGDAYPALLSAGTAELLAQARGPLLDPKVSAELLADGLRGASGSGLPDGAFAAGLQLNYQKDLARLFVNVKVDGKPLLTGQAKTALRVEELLREGSALLQRVPLSAQVDVQPVPLPAGLFVRGSVLGHAELKGTPRAPQVKVEASATGLLIGTWSVGQLALHAALDAKRILTAQATLTQPAAANSQPGSLSLDAIVPLPLDLTAPALKLALLAKHFQLDYQGLTGEGDPVALARGTLDSDLAIKGGMPQPSVSGALSLRGGQLLLAALPQLMRDIDVELHARPDGVLRLVQASASADEGHINATGQAQLAGGSLKSIELTTTVKNLPIVAGPIGLWLNTKLQATGSVSDNTLRVKIAVPYGTVRLPPLSLTGNRDVQSLGPLEDVRFVNAAARRAAARAAAAAQKRAAAAANEKKAPAILPQRVLVTLELPRSFTVSGPDLKTSVSGHLDGELSAKRTTGPVLTGEVHTQGGEVDLLGRRYDLERGEVSMSGEVPPNPLLNILISRKLDDDTIIYVQVTGTVSKPTLSFRSDPPNYDSSQVLSMVLSGSGGTGGSGTLQQHAVGTVAGFLVGQIKDKLGKAMPFDVVKLNVSGTDTWGTNQTALEVGKYLRDNMYLSYTQYFIGNTSTILHTVNNEQVSLDWYFLPNYLLSVMGGDQGVGALNLYWKKRF
jgi:autotransporter translocation and assembly factor TamB